MHWGLAAVIDVRARVGENPAAGAGRHGSNTIINRFRSARQLIDAEGFRANVGIVLLNAGGRVFWGRRVGMSGWQFPQGGIKRGETPEMAMYRELREEIGLRPEHVEIIGCTRDWLRYRLPRRYVRYHQQPLCIGQKQIWYVLKLATDETNVDLAHSDEPEFDHWRWIDYWESLRLVVPFKRSVYRRALSELAPLIATCSSVRIRHRRMP